MDEQKGRLILKNKKELIDGILLFLYGLLAYFCWRLAKFGEFKQRGKIIFIAFALLVVFLLIKFYFRNKEEQPKNAGLFKVKLGIFLALSFLFGGLILYEAVPYHGALSWKIQEWRNHKKIQVVHTNLYQEGLQGILSDIRANEPMPDDLYLADRLVLQFEPSGKITRLESFLYGKSKDGKVKTFLISYDLLKGPQLDLWLGGEANPDFSKEKRLAPFLTILDLSNFSSQARAWAKDETSPILEFLYDGKRSFPTDEGMVFIPGDADGDGVLGKMNALLQIQEGGEISGYEASLYIPSMPEIIPIRYIMEPEYRSMETLMEEEARQKIKEAQDQAEKNQEESENRPAEEKASQMPGKPQILPNQPEWTEDQKTGELYTFLSADPSKGYRLSVMDAAAGLRIYKLEGTKDGGHRWELLNPNPCLSETGLAMGVEFFTENLGFVGLESPTGLSSRIFRTADGGDNFEEVILPRDKIKTIPKEAAALGLEPIDFAYLEMPVKTDQGYALTLRVSDLKEGITFYSEDEGKSWHL